MLEDVDLSGIQDERARQCIVRLLNLVDEVTAALRSAQEEIQRLRDEIARLKGEQGKPTIKGNTPPPPSLPPDYSSERQRRVPKERSKSQKTETLRIDREQVLAVDPTLLPEDAEFKGYEDVVVQDLVVGTDNVLFHKEKYSSPGAGKTFLASLPRGYDGQFGPGINALALVLAYGANVSEPKLLELFRGMGVVLSAGQVSQLLIQDQERFHAEHAAVREAGLRSSRWQHLDDTSTRVNGQNHHCHLLCNPLYTSYQTTAAKDRQTVHDVLRLSRPRTYLLNAEAERLLAGVLAERTRQQLATLPRDQVLDEATMLGVLEAVRPPLGPQQRKWILDATAVAAYHAQDEVPVVEVLVCDDAPQFTWLTRELALCWVHEARHYHKLLPCFAPHQQVLDAFMKQFWDYYAALLAYRQAPTPEERERLRVQFEVLFATQTGYAALDERIARTRAKQTALLRVLDHPELPLHNNPAELGARQRVRKRDVSFGPRTETGAKAWDTFQTLAATATKLGVSFYAYLHDRVAQAYQLPGLDTLIAARAKDLRLDASWSGP